MRGKLVKVEDNLRCMFVCTMKKLYYKNLPLWRL